MDSKSIRYQNTRLLVEAAGGVSNFADKIGKGQSQTSQFAGTNPIKGIGNKVAREIEDAFDKPHGWLDVIHPENSNLIINNLDHITSVKINKELQALIKSLSYLDSQGKLSPDLIKAFKIIIDLVD